MKIRSMRRSMSVLLAAALLLGLLPTAALAEGAAVETIPCALTQDCTLPDGHEGDCAAPEPQPCALTEGCTLSDGHEGDCAASESQPCVLTQDCTLTDGHEGDCVVPELPADMGADGKTITGWTFVGGDLTEGELALPGVSLERQADLDTVVSMLPTAISAEVEGEAEAVQVAITGWSCPEYVRDEAGNWPVAGAYPFTAALDTVYACDPTPTVTVRLGGGAVYSGPIIGEGYAFVEGHLVISSDTVGAAWQKDTRIGMNEFFAAQAVQSAAVSDGVTALGAITFQNCTNLQYVVIPSNLTTIGDAAFESCASLSEIHVGDQRNVLPASVKVIGASAFNGCKKLNLTLPASLESLGASAFQDCYALTAVTFPAGLGTVGEGVFSGCSNLQSVTLPADVTSIGPRAFVGCGLTEIDLSKITSIGDYAFGGCAKLTAVTIPEGITSIGTGTFNSCTSLKTLKLPVSLESIGDKAFQSCTALESVTFPAGLRTIGNLAFFGCNALTAATLPPNLISIGYQAFDKCSKLDTLTFLGLTPPATVQDAFPKRDHENLGTIYYPVEANTAYNDWFDSAGLICWKTFTAPTILEVYFEDNNSGGTSQTENEMKTAIMLALNNENPRTYTTIKINHRAFSITNYNWRYLRSLFAKDSGWDALTTLDLSGMKNLATLEDNVIGAVDSSKLLRVALPPSLTTIGTNTFKGCTGLTEMTFPSGLTTIGQTAFYNCPALTSLTFLSDAPPSTIGDAAFELGSDSGTVYHPQNGPGYTVDWLKSIKLPGWTLSTIRAQAQTIGKSTYNRSDPFIGEEISSRDGAYTPNDGGPEGTHLYQWKRADNADRTGNVVNLAITKHYTTTADDYGKYIWLETTPVGDGSLEGVPVQGDVLRVGVRLLVEGWGDTFIKNLYIDGSRYSRAGRVVYGPAVLSYEKANSNGIVLWSDTHEGDFSGLTSSDSGETITYTPPMYPRSSPITITANAYTRTEVGYAFYVWGDPTKYSFDQDNDLLTIHTGAMLTISNRDSRAVNTGIVVADGARDIELTLSGINIDADSAFRLGENAQATLILAEESENYLRSYGRDMAGLWVPEGATLSISGSGKLTAIGDEGAGIGGRYGSERPRGDGEHSGYITIGDYAQVTATSRESAGIGGGAGVFIGIGGAGYVTIGDQAQVTATSEKSAAIGTGADDRFDPDNSSDSEGRVNIGAEAQVTAVSSEGAGIKANYLSIAQSPVIMTTGGIQADSSNIFGGVVFENGSGQVYGMFIKPQDFEIPSHYTLRIPSGSWLEIIENRTVTNSGALIVEDGGALTVKGRGVFTVESGGVLTVEQGGRISGEGKLTGDGTFSGEGPYELKVTRTIGPPTVQSTTHDSVTLQAMTPRGDGTVTYAKNTQDTVPPEGWQSETTFTGLTPDTDYYFFARVTGGAIYKDVTSTGTAGRPGTMLPVSTKAIPGVTAPARGAAPVTAIESEQYTGTVSWSPDPGAAFAADTAYTATITLTPKAGYTLQGVAENFFTVAGATTTNGAGSGVVTAIFPATEKPTYTVTVHGGEASPAETVEGGTVTVTATVPSGQRFTGWTFSPGVTFVEGGKNTATAKFTMPARAVTATASFESTGSGGGGGGGGGSGSTITPTEEAVKEVEKAKDGDTVELDMPSNGKIPGKVLEEAAGKDITLEINAGKDATWIINGKDIPTGQKLSDLNLKVDAKANTIPVKVINALTREEKVMQLALSHSGDFGFSLTLRLDTGKDNAGLFANLYYYNEATKALEYQSTAKIGANGKADIPFTHASSYAVIIDVKSHAPVEWKNPFTDVTEGVWFYDAVEYVVQNGLMNGTSETTFSSSGTMTRGMAVTVLYRLAGSPQAGGGGAFTDVPAGAYYSNAVAWASSKGIVKGTTSTTFDPDRPVTRQELAVIMSGYAQAMGHKLPATQAPVTFSDADAIGSWAADAVQAMQRAGILNGKEGNRFDPTGTATRAEVAVVIRRFSELVAGQDPAGD